MNEKGAAKKRILLIGEKPDAWLFAMLQGEGYEVAALEFSSRVWGVHREYRPDCIIVHLRYPKDIAMLEECVARDNRAPVVAAFSILMEKVLTDAVKQKAASYILLPTTPKTIRETLRRLAPAQKEEQCSSPVKERLKNDSTKDLFVA